MDTTSCRAAARSALFPLDVTHYFTALQAFDVANANRKGPFAVTLRHLTEDLKLAVCSSSSPDALDIIPCVVRLLRLYPYAAFNEAQALTSVVDELQVRKLY